jgi:hypothetical protein
MPPTARKPKKPKTKIKRTNPKQSARFIKAAKELGLGDADSGVAFELAMDTLAKSKKKSSSN